MSTTEDKLRYLIDTKNIIKQSIIDKGVTISDSDTFRSYADKISSIQAGGSVTTGEFVCRAIDYDGTILKEEHLDAGETFTLPSLPTHDGLIAQGWSSPVDIVNNMVVVTDRDLIFGVMYETASGLSEFDIELTKNTKLTITMNMDGTKDWGDGVTNTETTHTYANYGKYTITCNGVNIGSNLWGQSNLSELTYNYFCLSARLSKNVTVKEEAFIWCCSLEYIIIPRGITQIGESAVSNCFSLKCFIIPDSVAIMNRRLCYSCDTLKTVVLPKSITEIGQESMFGCWGLMNLTIPDSILNMGIGAVGSCYILNNLTIIGVTSISQRLCESCYGLKKIKLGNVTSIGTDGFRTLMSLNYIDFSNCISIPTLGTNALSFINGNAKIIVPDSLYDSWIVATNWTLHTKQIYKVSEVI